MRWNQLFADLEAQSQALQTRDRAGEVDERARAETARVSVTHRLAPAVGTVVTVRCRGDVRVVGTVVGIGADWLLLDEGPGRETVVNLANLLTTSGLGRLSSSPDGPVPVGSKLPLRSVLRGIARDRSPVRMHLVDATTLDGTIDRVGADFVELAAHGAGELRRRADVRDVNLVVQSAVSAVRRQL